MKVVHLHGSLDKLTFKLYGERVFNKSKLFLNYFLFKEFFKG